MNPTDCVCGHSRESHEHYRSGTDCAICSCPKFHPARRRWRFMHKGASATRGRRDWATQLGEKPA